MSESKYTKGKWEIALKQTELMGDYVVETSDGLTIIATVHRSPRMENSTFRDEAYENALLIAAAPETKEKQVLTGIELTRKDDGHWLAFKTTKGNGACLRIESLKDKLGYITWKAIMEWAEDQSK